MLFEHLRFLKIFLLLVTLQLFLYVPGFVLLPLSYFVFFPLATAHFQIFRFRSVSLFPSGINPKWKSYIPSQMCLQFQRRSWETEVSLCVQAAWQLCKTLSPSKFSWGEGHLHFPFWQHVKKWLINKSPLRWRAFSTIPADEGNSFVPSCAVGTAALWQGCWRAE